MVIVNSNLFTFLLLFILAHLSIATRLKSMKGGSGVEREWRLRKSQCEAEDCSHFIPEEGYNCVHNCTSPACYEKIYSAQPLEDGEVDFDRYRKFVECLRSEYVENRVSAVVVVLCII